MTPKLLTWQPGIWILPEQTSWPHWWWPWPAMQSGQGERTWSPRPLSIGLQTFGQCLQDGHGKNFKNIPLWTLNIFCPMYHPSSSWHGTDGMQKASHYWLRWTINSNIRIRQMIFLKSQRWMKGLCKPSQSISFVCSGPDFWAFGFPTICTNASVFECLFCTQNCT